MTKLVQLFRIYSLEAHKIIIENGKPHPLHHTLFLNNMAKSGDFLFRERKVVVLGKFQH
jgi:hypothetical protein